MKYPDYDSLDDYEKEAFVIQIIKAAKQHPDYHIDQDFKNRIALLETALANFEEAAAATLCRQLLDEIDLDKKLEEADTAFASLRKELIKSIQQNPPNAAALKSVAYQIIETEKEHGMHNPNDWKDLEL